MKKGIFLVVVIAVILFKILLNAESKGWEGISGDIEFSKNNGLFLNSYKLSFQKNLSDKPDSIYDYVINDIEVWSEKKWNRRPFLIFFHPVQEEAGIQYIFKSKENFRYDELSSSMTYVKVKGEQSSGSIFKESNGYVCQIVPEPLHAYEDLDLIFYENNLISFFEAKLKD